MANEIRAYYPAGSSTYAIVERGSDGYWLNGSAYEDPQSANWTSYARALTPVSGLPLYRADFPGGSAGLYNLHYFLQEGEDPAPTDPPIRGITYLDWDGSAEKGVGTLQDLSAAQVNAEVDTALGEYDAPTKAELDTAVAAILAYGDSHWVTAMGFSTLTQADIRDAVGLASANLDTQLAALAAYAASILDHTGSSGVVVASASKSGYSLSASGLDGITAESGVNLRQAVVIMGAALSGLLSGMGTGTITIKGMDSATTRITAVYDENNNRTSVTLNLPV